MSSDFAKEKGNVHLCILLDKFVGDLGLFCPGPGENNVREGAESSRDVVTQWEGFSV